ncbi:MAG: YfcE family phosphodiesterase [Verrucomicrobiales bacterium]|nr:YfcE family phosphodiesterase [Verrucomicrobiales bacterium]
MRVAVLSDIHDHIWNLEKALKQVEQSGCEAMLFLGDFCAPFTLAQLAEGFSGPIHGVFGNNDGDRFNLGKVGAGVENVTLHGEWAEIELGGVKIGMNHYPELARRMAESGAYGAVFSGHDHLKYVHRVGPTLWANPGEVMGRFGEPSFGIFDTEGGGFEHVGIG